MSRDRKPKDKVVKETMGNIPDDLYLYLKRLYLTAGKDSMRACAKGRPYNPVEYETLEEAFLYRFSQDSRRDDLNLSKCMHCLLNRKCFMGPTGCRFIDRKVPIHQLAFKVVLWVDRHCEKYVYDCGWIVDSRGVEDDDVAVMPDEITDRIDFNSEMRIVPIAPFSCVRNQYRAVPKRGEKRFEFINRINGVVTRIQEELKDRRKDVKAALRSIVRASGHEDELKTKYGNDIMFMVSDWWPDMTPDEILDMYSPDGKVTPLVFAENRRKYEKGVEP